MSVEFLAHYSTELQQLYYLSPVALGYLGWLWRIIKQERSDRDGMPVGDLEIHHIKRKWQGGGDEGMNLIALKRDEHALEHFRAAKKSGDKRERRLEYGAVKLIVTRMTDSERKEFNRRINGHD